MLGSLNSFVNFSSFFTNCSTFELWRRPSSNWWIDLCAQVLTNSDAIYCPMLSRQIKVQTCWYLVLTEPISTTVSKMTSFRCMPSASWITLSFFQFTYHFNSHIVTVCNLCLLIQYMHLRAANLYAWLADPCVAAGVLFLQEQRVRLSGSLVVVDEVRTRDVQYTRPQELPASPFQQYDGCIGWLILILQPLQTFVELARCESVMTTRAEFHFSWVYTFSATPRSLRIWAPVPPRETGCDPALPAQLCW